MMHLYIGRKIEEGEAQEVSITKSRSNCKRMKSLQFDEHVGESSTDLQNSGTSKPTPDDPQYDYSSSSDQKRSKKRSKMLIRQYFKELSAIIPQASNKEVMLMDKEASSILEDAIKYMKQLQERVKKLEEELRLEIEVKTDGQDHHNAHIKIICQKQKGQIDRIIREIEKLHLNVSSVSALPFGDQLVISVSADQMGNEFSMTANDLKKNLRIAL